MLSNPLHRFSAYNALPSNGMMSNGHLPSNHMHSGLHTLADGSQYALQQLQQHVDVHQNGQVHRGHNNKHRQHPYGPGPGNGRSASTSGPIRRRISRACDQCNQLRTKCDGQAPCAHCVGKSPTAEYFQFANHVQSLGWVANTFGNERSEARLLAKIWHNKPPLLLPMVKNHPQGNHQTRGLPLQSHEMKMALQLHLSTMRPPSFAAPRPRDL